MVRLCDCGPLPTWPVSLVARPHQLLKPCGGFGCAPTIRTARSTPGSSDEIRTHLSLVDARSDGRHYDPPGAFVKITTRQERKLPCGDMAPLSGLVHLLGPLREVRRFYAHTRLIVMPVWHRIGSAVPGLPCICRRISIHDWTNWPEHNQKLLCQERQSRFAPRRGRLSFGYGVLGRPSPTHRIGRGRT